MQILSAAFRQLRLASAHWRLRRDGGSHLAVIEPLAPGRLMVVAGGTRHACTAALEAWIEQHGLPDGAHGWVVRRVAETVPEPGVGVYTVPRVSRRGRSAWPTRPPRR